MARLACRTLLLLALPMATMGCGIGRSYSMRSLTAPAMRPSYSPAVTQAPPVPQKPVLTEKKIEPVDPWTETSTIEEPASLIPEQEEAPLPPMTEDDMPPMPPDLEEASDESFRVNSTGISVPHSSQDELEAEEEHSAASVEVSFDDGPVA